MVAWVVIPMALQSLVWSSPLVLGRELHLLETCFIAMEEIRPGRLALFGVI